MTKIEGEDALVCVIRHEGNRRRIGHVVDRGKGRLSEPGAFPQENPARRTEANREEEKTNDLLHEMTSWLVLKEYRGTEIKRLIRKAFELCVEKIVTT